DEDVYGIWEVANAVSQERQRIGKPAADVNAAVGWLVPKPFTPLQWMAQPRLEYFLAVREKLRELGRATKPRSHAAMKGESRAPGPEVIDGGMGGYGSAAAMAADNDDALADSPARDPRNSG